MDDLEFFDTLYQGWTKTTEAEGSYWMPEEDEEAPGFFNIYAVSADEDGEETRKLVASFVSEEDSAFITALHGCFADLTRRLHTAVDEAERYDCEKDFVIVELAQVSEENNELRERLRKYEPVED